MNLQPVVDAIKAHNWVLLAALVVGFLVAVAKQGWAGAWIASKMPARALPYYAVVLSLLGAAATQLTQGVPLNTVISNALAAAAIAIAGHNVVIEGLRGGVELIPQYKKAPTTTTPPETKPS